MKFGRITVIAIAACVPYAVAAQDAPAAVAEPAACELHVWPTRNYISLNTGVLVGLGPIGAAIDVAGHADRMKTVKDLMIEYLDTDAQLAELNRLGIVEKLRLAGHRVIVEPAFPSSDEQKEKPELKQQAKNAEVRVKAKQRLTASTSPCYAELLSTHIFYHKAAIYGSNLFAGWTYRSFGDRATVAVTASGQVKNPLENFPPKTPEMIDAARAELRDAYAKDFAEYVEKKVVPAVRTPTR